MNRTRGELISERAIMQPLLHAARVGLRLALRGVAQADEVEQLVGARGLHAVERREEAQVLDPGEAVVQIGILEDRVDERLDAVAIGDGVEARDHRAPGGRTRAPGEHADRRRLARAVVAEQAEDLALGDAERDAVDRAHRAVVLLEVRDLDHRLSAHARSG